MSNGETNAFFSKGFSEGMKLSATARLIFTVLCHRYDSRPDKGSAYPGMPEFMRVTGKTRTTVQDALKELKDLGVIIQTKPGYRGQRAEYVPIYALQLQNKSVGYTDTLKSKESAMEFDPVGYAGVMGTDLTPKGSAMPYLINTINTLNTNKYINNETDHVYSDQAKTETKDAPSGKMNYDRWNVITPYLGEYEKYIKPGPNYERLLNLLEEKGIRLKDIGACIEKIDFTNAYSCGGRLEQELNDLAGVSKASTKPGSTDWCRREGCDSKTRTWPEPSERSDGTFTANCPYCHPNEIKQNEQVQTFNFLDELGETPFRSVDE
jgi:hypothetical protein